jgi:elongator complex protein 5
MSFLIDDDAQKFPLVILQSSLAQSCLPILRRVVNDPKASSFNLLFCLLHSPSSLVDDISSDTLEIHDWLDYVPGYCDASSIPSEDLLDIVKRGIHDRSFLGCVALN